MQNYKVVSLKSILSTASALAILLGGVVVEAVDITTAADPAQLSDPGGWVGNVAPVGGDNILLGGAHDVYLNDGPAADFGNFDIQGNTGKKIYIPNPVAYSIASILNTGGAGGETVDLLFGVGNASFTIGDTGGLLGNIDFSGGNDVVTITNGDIVGNISNGAAATLNLNGATNITSETLDIGTLGTTNGQTVKLTGSETGGVHSFTLGTTTGTASIYFQIDTTTDALTLSGNIGATGNNGANTLNKITIGGNFASTLNLNGANIVTSGNFAGDNIAIILNVLNDSSIIAGLVAGGITTTVNNGVTLTVGDGTKYNGAITGQAANQGSIVVNGTVTLGGQVGGNVMNAVTVSNGANLTTSNPLNTTNLILSGSANFTAGGAIQSNTIKIATGTLTAGGAITGIGGAGNNAVILFTDGGTFNLGTRALTGSVDFANQNATLTLSANSSVSQTVNSTVGSNGTINVTGNSTITGIIGATNAVKNINVTGGTLTASASVSSTNVTLSNAGSLGLGGALQSNTIKIATGTLTAGGAITGIGGAGNNADILFTDNGTFNLGSNALTGSVDFANQNATLTLAANSSVSQSVDSTVGSNGTINVTGNSSIGGNIGATNAIKSLTVNGSKLTLGGTNFNVTTMTFTNSTLAPNTNITATGDLTLAGSTLSLSGNTITLTGNVTATGNLTINTLLNGANAGKLVVIGASDLSASTITINVDNASTLAGGTITLVGNVTKDSTNPVTITGATGGYTFAYGGNGKLVITAPPTPPTPPSTTPGVVDQVAVANFNQSLTDPLSPVSQAVAEVPSSAQSVLTDLLSQASSGSLSGEAADYLNDVVASIQAGNGYGLQSLQENAPTNLAASSAAVAETVQDSIGYAISSQLDSMDNNDFGDEGVSSGSERLKANTTFWAQGSISKVLQGADKDSSGFKSITTGLTIGVDGSVSEKMRLGFAIIRSDGKTKSKGKSAGNSSLSESWLASIYSSYEINSKWSFKSALSFGITNSNSKQYKTVVKTGKKQLATSNNQIQQFSADIGLSYRQRITKQISLRPEVGLRVNGSNNLSYSENAPRGLRRTVHKTFGASYQGNIGLGLSANRKIGQAKFSGSVKVSMSQIIGGKNPSQITLLDGQSIPTYTTSKPSNPRRYSFGTNLSLQYGIMEYSASYNVGKANKNLSQSGSLQIKVNL